MIRDLKDGHLLDAFDLPPVDATASPGPQYLDRGNTSLGFDGRLLWIYEYTPEHNSDMLGTKTNEHCGYEVYDAMHGGAHVRSLSVATGDWARMTKSCRTRALLPTADGGAIAFVVGNERRAEVVKFDGPP